MRGRERLKAILAGGAAGTPPRISVALGQGALLAAVTVLCCALIAGWGFGYRYSPLAMLLDTLLLFPLMATLLLVARWRWMVVGTTVAMGFLGMLAHAIKNDQLGVPLMAADLAPLWQLLNILPGWRWLLAWVAVILVVVFSVAPLWPRRGGWRWLLPVPLIVLGWTLMGGWVARLGGGDVEDPREIGGVAFLASDIAASLQYGTEGPGRDEVAEALADLSPPRPSAQLVSRRNVYMVLLETMWDPLQLEGYQFSRDPWDARFRRMWEMGGRSHILSPSFGGATANAEFEALCGMPASSTRVLFENGVKRPLQCLPRVMRDAGYTTMASHPYKSNFWNREKAYQYAGFEAYFPIDAYELDDMDGMFLSDQSSYAQLLARQKMASAPLFSYVVSLSSHYPFTRDLGKRPDMLGVTPDDGLLGAYANAVAWSTAAFMDFVEQVMAQDPDALVVAFGDHAPVLGSQPNPYVQAGLRGGIEGDDLVALAQAPLLVIDGDNGPVAMGDVALYELPNMLLGSLQPDVRLHAGIFDDVPFKARPFLGHVLTSAGSGERGRHWQVCEPGTELCTQTRQTLKSMRTLRRDLAEGRAHALAMIGQPAVPAVSMQISRPFPACALSVKAWGPEGAIQGQPFNRQAEGRSAFWFSVDEARGDLKIEVGGEVVDLLVAGKAASASFQSPDFLNKPGHYPVRAFCAGEPPWEIGQFVVSPEVAVASAQVGAADPVTDTCQIGVSQWGPRSTERRVKFNVQADGSAAFWFALDSVAGHPVLRVGEQELALVIAGNRASASLVDTSLLDHPGNHPVSVQCPGQSAVPLGDFSVRSGIATGAVAAAPSSSPTCEVQIQAWGPQSTSVGNAFNRQADGSSALWLKTAQTMAIKALQIGDDTAPVHAGDGTISAQFLSPGFLARAGSHPLRAVCQDGTHSGVLGQFTVVE